MNAIRTLVALALLSCSLGALAQWQWLDKDGRKVFSDRAPPPEVPEKNILKRPGQRLASPATSAPGEIDAPASTPLATPKIPSVDKELEAKKKQTQAAAAAKRKAAEEQVFLVRRENCTRARTARKTFEVGGPIARINAEGQREFMDEQAKAAEVQRLESIISRDCN